MADFKAAVRRQDGSVEHYEVLGAANWMAARQFVFEQLSPPPRAVLVAETSAPRRQPDLFKPAA